MDLALLCAEFAELLGAAGVPVPVERIAWWAEATVAADPATIIELYWLARVTLVDRAERLDTFDAVFAKVFRGMVDIADFRGDRNGAARICQPATPRPRQAAVADERPAAGRHRLCHGIFIAGEFQPRLSEGRRYYAKLVQGA